MVDRPPRVAVIGAGDAFPEEVALAESVGARLASSGAVLVCGGLGGVMEASARGCAEAGGLTVGVLPGGEPSRANEWIRLPLATGMGEGRNVLVVRCAEAVIAVGGSWGTLSEIALARKIGRPVILLGPAAAEDLDLPRTADPAEAVAWALEQAARGGSVEDGSAMEPADSGGL